MRLPVFRWARVPAWYPLAAFPIARATSPAWCMPGISWPSSMKWRWVACYNSLSIIQQQCLNYVFRWFYWHIWVVCVCMCACLSVCLKHILTRDFHSACSMAVSTMSHRLACCRSRFTWTSLEASPSQPNRHCWVPSTRWSSRMSLTDAERIPTSRPSSVSPWSQCSLLCIYIHQLVHR